MSIYVMTTLCWIQLCLLAVVGYLTCTHGWNMLPSSPPQKCCTVAIMHVTLEMSILPARVAPAVVVACNTH